MSEWGKRKALFPVRAEWPSEKKVPATLHNWPAAISGLAFWWSSIDTLA